MNEHKDTSAAEHVDSNEQEVTLADFERTETLPLADTQPTQTMPATQTMPTTQSGDVQDDTVAMPQIHASEGDTAVLPAMETNATDAADTTTVLPHSAGDDDAQTVTMPHVATDTADAEIDDADSATIDFGAFDDVTLETPESEPAFTADADGVPTDSPAEDQAANAAQDDTAPIGTSTDTSADTTAAMPADTPAEEPAAMPAGSASTLAPGAQSVPLYSTAQPQSAPGPYVQVPSMQFELPVIQKTGPSSATIILGVFMLIIGLIGLIIGLYGVTLPLTLLSWISDDPRVLFAIGCAALGGLLILVAIIWSIVKVISNGRSNKSATDD